MKKTLILFFIIVSAIVLVSCIDPFLPVYEKTSEDGISVYVDGVRYKQLPEIEWNVNQYGKTIGYAGDRNISVHVIEGDTNRDFMFLHGFWDEMYVLYRADKDIPDVSVSSVDKVAWGEYTYENSEVGNEYSNTVEDKEVIKELFDLIENGEKTKDITPTKLFMSIDLFCSDIPGASYSLRIGVKNGKPVLGRDDIKYVYVSKEFLEKIAGKQIDNEQFLPVYHRTDIMSVDIDGVIYSQLPSLNWEVNTTDGEIIGCAGDSGTFILESAEDTERNFVFLDDRSTDDSIDYWPYRRTDKDIPDVSAQSVDKIVWEDNILDSRYTYTVEDKKIIARLFGLLDIWPVTNGPEPTYINDKSAAAGVIKLYCSDLPGAFYPIEVWVDNGKIVCGNKTMSYVVFMPSDLLEKIAGKQIGISELTAD